MANSKSKSKSKSNKKKPPPKRKASKTKKKNTINGKKVTVEKKNKHQKTKIGKKITKDNKRKSEKAPKKGKKKNANETKGKNDKLTVKPTENNPEVLDLPKPIMKIEPKQELDELPIIMECTESDDETIQSQIPQDNLNRSQIDDKIVLTNHQTDLSNVKYENNFDQCDDDFKIDIDLGNELIDEELTLNLDCFVNLQQLALSNDGSNNFVQGIGSNEYTRINPGPDLTSSIVTNVSGINDINRVSENKEARDNTLKTLQNEEVINCTCGYREEDGLMIQCDICLTWQHALCCGMNNDSEVPENYLCAYCTQPLNVRPTQRYSYAKHFLTLSKLPRFSQRTCEEQLLKRREGVLTKTFEMTADIRKIVKLERTITAKLSIAEEPDHPKLYMWSANWDSQDPSTYLDPVSSELIVGPIGERPIESVDCRLRLLDKIEADQQEMACRLSMIYEQLNHLESDDYDRKTEEINLKRVLRMFEKDLKTIATAAKVS